MLILIDADADWYWFCFVLILLKINLQIARVRVRKIETLWMGTVKFMWKNMKNAQNIENWNKINLKGIFC